MMRTVLGSLLCVGGVIVLVGCGGPVDPNRPKTIPVSVAVTYKGAPVAGATVTFQPAASQQRGAVAVTDDRGQAEMWTFEPGSGVLPGSYNVSVSKVAVTSMPDPEKTSPQEYARLERELASQPPKHEVPAKYSETATSGLTVDVSESGDNRVTLDLTD